MNSETSKKDDADIGYHNSTGTGTLVSLKDSGLEFDGNETLMFVDKDRCRIYPDHNGKNYPTFITAKHRQLCLDHYLAFHSKSIGIENAKRNGESQNNNSEHIEKSKLKDPEGQKPEKSFLYLEFNGDREVYGSMITSEKYLHILSWKKLSDLLVDAESAKTLPESEVKIRSAIRETASLFTDIKQPFIGVIVRINKFNSETDRSPLHIQSFYINSFELFVEVKLPCIVKTNDDKDLIVCMSGYIKDMYNDNREMFALYNTDDGNTEVMIADQKQKEGIVSTVLSKVIEYLDRNSNKDSADKESTTDKTDPDNKVLVLSFKNGDTDLFSALVGTIRYKYFQELNIADVKREFYYEKIEKKVRPTVVVVYMPRSKQVMYYAIGSRSSVSPGI